jgi:hypothetical protein
MRVRIREDVLKQDLQGEAVLLDMGSGTYYRLNATGALAWPVLVEQGDSETALQKLQEAYTGVPEERLRSDLTQFIEMLVSHGLAEPVDAGSPA